jgi:hypothetical protein
LRRPVAASTGLRKNAVMPSVGRRFTVDGPAHAMPGRRATIPAATLKTRQIGVYAVRLSQ